MPYLATKNKNINSKEGPNNVDRDLADNFKRTILENPKQDKKITIELGIKEGFITPFWQRKITKFLSSLIPSRIKPEQQVWLDKPEKLVEFVDNIKNPDYDLSSIEYVCISCTISDVYDIVDFFSTLKLKLPDHAKVFYCNYNWKWEWAFILSGLIGFSMKKRWGNFYRDADLNCFLDMSGWENIQEIRRYLLPFKLKFISTFFDNLVRLPILRGFALNTFFVARKKSEGIIEDHSVTVLIPCKNEETNIEAIVKRMPLFGKSIELIFVNDKSTDRTESKILSCQKQFPQKNIKLIEGDGKGKGEAVREGMKTASGDICMILDADLSVIPEDLPQFYNAINSRRADFIHGTRLVYSQEYDAMRPANILGNILFSLIFSYVLEQRVTDTLCGTKVYWRRDWLIFEEMKSILKDTDVWGDYNLIFGAARFGLKVGELPVRYFQRLEGVTKMNKRIRNGLIMLRVAWHALFSVKFIG